MRASWCFRRSAVVSTSLHSLALQSGQGTSLQGSLRTLCCSLHSRSTSLRPRLFIQYACRVRTPRPQLFEHCNHNHIALQNSTWLYANLQILIYLLHFSIYRQQTTGKTLFFIPLHILKVFTEGFVYIIHTNFIIALYLFASIDFNCNAYL